MKYNAVPLSQVKLQDPYQINALEKEISYLKALEPDRLTAGYYETRGLQPKAERYPCWESSEIQGHTLGHYMTALSQATQSTGDPQLKDRLHYILQELTICQHENGYLSAFNEVLFDRVENKEPAWVPWYTMHKIVNGLISAYQLDQNPVALNLLENLAGWISKRVNRWTSETQKTVLAVEYGGMNDCLYETYRITGNPDHLKAAHQFDELPLFEALEQHRDILNNLHANTTIPKFLGAMKRVMVTGDKDFYLKACENFWEIVINHHSYITGGNSEWEHFGEPDILDKERTNCTCETCNTYNMLKFSRGLFEITGDVKYLHYYENTLTNAILPSQNPETGMTMYFQPMATGYFKVYGTPFDKFWCCTGSGMENFTKLNDGIYYTTDESLLIGRYSSSQFSDKDRNLSLSMKADLLKSDEIQLEIEPLRGEKTTLCLKLIKPQWLAGEAEIQTVPRGLNQKDLGDFIELTGSIRGKEQIRLKLPMGLSYENLPDGQNTYAFKYGPFVLSAALGTKNMEESKTGVEVTIPTRKVEIEDFLVVENIKEWLDSLKEKHLSHYAPYSMTIEDKQKKLLFIPHYLQHKERYGIYWQLLQEGSSELEDYKKNREEKEAYLQSIIDSIPLGNDQYELEHQIKGEKTLSDTRDGYRYRELQPGGSVSYRMKVATEGETLLEFKYSLSSKFTFEVTADEKLLKTIENQDSHYLDYQDAQLKLTEKMSLNKESMIIAFKNTGSESMRIVDLLLTRQDL